jgi:2,4-dienoyl-CoA reductase-like NADH-dependent reductase (Old Yellow Enzyme family)
MTQGTASAAASPRYSKQLVTVVRAATHAHVVRLAETYGETQAEIQRRALDAGLDAVELELANRARREAEVTGTR